MASGKILSELSEGIKITATEMWIGLFNLEIYSLKTMAVILFLCVSYAV